jgi:hypothetical protein
VFVFPLFVIPPACPGIHGFPAFAGNDIVGARVTLCGGDVVMAGRGIIGRTKGGMRRSHV